MKHLYNIVYWNNGTAVYEGCLSLIMEGMHRFICIVPNVRHALLNMTYKMILRLVGDIGYSL